MNNNYKTMLCKQWEIFGKCSYEYRCVFAHGKAELMLPGEYNQKKRYRLRKKTKSITSNLPEITCPEITCPEITSPKITSPKITSPLNPKAKEFEMINFCTNDSDYDKYWKIIHNIIIENNCIPEVPSYPQQYHPSQQYPPQIHRNQRGPPGFYLPCTNTN